MFATLSSTESWLIDNAFKNHMTCDQDLLRDLDTTYISKFRIGNGAYISVKGKGTIAIEGYSSLILFYDVLLVPKIDQNLLSVGQLMEKGYKISFEDKVCMIRDVKDNELFKIQMSGRSFALNFEEEDTAMHKEESDLILWHKRLGHFHSKALIYVKNNKLVEGLLELEKDLLACVSCQYGKQTRLPFHKNKSWRATHKLQLIHTYVGGPLKTPSLNDSKYYIAFIDDHA